MPECSFACLDTPSCFSFNLGATPDINDRFPCELLPSDKYNNSNQFVHSNIFHHFSIATLTNAPLQTRVTRMLHATTPKDLTTALVREDLKATGELTARNIDCKILSLLEAT
ncbi:uncharacterized protein LOC141859337 isoform X2 [Acropora palmata]|uniref:uncharacterized protein LOC141859337 isoform X2 n=1 Tax=Acropora palmata TaxID=6131 RepID=UPI003DA165AF